MVLSDALTYLTSKNEFTSSTTVGKDNGAITQPENSQQANVGNWATGSNDEALADHIYGQNEAVLTVAQLQSILEQRRRTGARAALPATGRANPMPLIAMVDVNIYIAENEDTSTVRELRKEGGSISAALGKEPQRYLGVK